MESTNRNSKDNEKTLKIQQPQQATKENLDAKKSSKPSYSNGKHTGKVRLSKFDKFCCFIAKKLGNPFKFHLKSRKRQASNNSLRSQPTKHRPTVLSQEQGEHEFDLTQLIMEILIKCSDTEAVNPITSSTSKNSNTTLDRACNTSATHISKLQGLENSKTRQDTNSSLLCHYNYPSQFKKITRSRTDHSPLMDKQREQHERRWQSFNDFEARRNEYERIFCKPMWHRFDDNWREQPKHDFNEELEKIIYNMYSQIDKVIFSSIAEDLSTTQEAVREEDREREGSIYHVYGSTSTETLIENEALLQNIPYEQSDTSPSVSDIIYTMPEQNNFEDVNEQYEQRNSCLNTAQARRPAAGSERRRNKRQRHAQSNKHSTVTTKNAMYCEEYGKDGRVKVAVYSPTSSTTIIFNEEDDLRQPQERIRRDARHRRPILKSYSGTNFDFEEPHCSTKSNSSEEYFMERDNPKTSKRVEERKYYPRKTRRVYENEDHVVPQTTQAQNSWEGIRVEQIEDCEEETTQKRGSRRATHIPYDNHYNFEKYRAAESKSKYQEKSPKTIHFLRQEKIRHSFKGEEPRRSMRNLMESTSSLIESNEQDGRFENRTRSSRIPMRVPEYLPEAPTEYYHRSPAGRIRQQNLDAYSSEDSIRSKSKFAQRKYECRPMRKSFRLQSNETKFYCVPKQKAQQVSQSDVRKSFKGRADKTAQNTERNERTERRSERKASQIFDSHRRTEYECNRLRSHERFSKAKKEPSCYSRKENQRHRKKGPQKKYYSYSSHTQEPKYEVKSSQKTFNDKCCRNEFEKRDSSTTRRLLCRKQYVFNESTNRPRNSAPRKQYEEIENPKRMSHLKLKISHRRFTHPESVQQSFKDMHSAAQEESVYHSITKAHKEKSTGKPKYLKLRVSIMNAKEHAQEQSSSKTNATVKSSAVHSKPNSNENLSSRIDISGSNQTKLSARFSDLSKTYESRSTSTMQPERTWSLLSTQRERGVQTTRETEIFKEKTKTELEMKKSVSFKVQEEFKADDIDVNVNDIKQELKRNLFNKSSHGQETDAHEPKTHVKVSRKPTCMSCGQNIIGPIFLDRGVSVCHLCRSRKNVSTEKPSAYEICPLEEAACYMTEDNKDFEYVKEKDKWVCKDECNVFITPPRILQHPLCPCLLRHGCIEKTEYEAAYGKNDKFYYVFDQKPAKDRKPDGRYGPKPLKTFKKKRGTHRNEDRDQDSQSSVNIVYERKQTLNSTSPEDLTQRPSNANSIRSYGGESIDSKVSNISLIASGSGSSAVPDLKPTRSLYSYNNENISSSQRAHIMEKSYNTSLTRLTNNYEISDDFMRTPPLSRINSGYSEEITNVRKRKSSPPAAHSLASGNNLKRTKQAYTYAINVPEYATNNRLNPMHRSNQFFLNNTQGRACMHPNHNCRPTVAVRYQNHHACRNFWCVCSNREESSGAATRTQWNKSMQANTYKSLLKNSAPIALEKVTTKNPNISATADETSNFSMPSCSKSRASEAHRLQINKALEDILRKIRNQNSDSKFKHGNSRNQEQN